MLANMLFGPDPNAFRNQMRMRLNRHHSAPWLAVFFALLTEEIKLVALLEEVDFEGETVTMQKFRWTWQGYSLRPLHHLPLHLSPRYSILCNSGDLR